MTSEIQKQYLSNIKKIYVFSFFWMFLVIIPVIVPYFLDLGLSMEQVFQLQAIFGLTVGILEVPSGYLCDLIGRKKTIVIGTFFSGIGFSSLLVADSFPNLVIFEIIIGIAMSLVSGADLSILYESLNKIDNDRDKRTKAMANIQFSKTTAESIGSILGGLLVNLTFHAVVMAQAITSWFPFFIALFIKEPEYEKMQSHGHLDNMKNIFRHLFRSDKLLSLVFLNLVLWGLSTFIAVWIFQKYWQQENIPLYYFGFLWAGYNFTVGVIGKQVHRWEKKYGPTPLLIAVAILPIIGYFGMAYFSGWLGVVIGLCFKISRGINQVILRDALNWRTPSEFRATANSLISLFFRLGFCLVGPLVGYLIDQFGINFSLNALGIAFTFISIFCMYPLIKEVKKIAPEEIPN